MMLARFLPWEKRTKRIRPFLPTDIPGCEQWVEGSRGISYGISPAVSAWADQSGNGKNYTQIAGSRQPLWGMATTDNGRPALTYDGQTASHDDALVCASITIGHAFLVAKCIPATLPYTFEGLWIGSDGEDPKWLMFQGDDLTNQWYSTPPAGVTRWRDGVAENLLIGTQAQHIYEIKDTSPSARACLTSGNTIDRAWPGWIAEIIVYSAILSAANTAKIRLHLATKYAISGVTL